MRSRSDLSSPGISVNVSLQPFRMLRPRLFGDAINDGLQPVRMLRHTAARRARTSSSLVTSAGAGLTIESRRFSQSSKPSAFSGRY
jgi:hypothetical protein